MSTGKDMKDTAKVVKRRKRSAKVAAKGIELVKKLAYKHRERILNGRLIAIDPSAGSTSSNPGFAVFEKGEFVEQGILDVPFSPDLNIRLQMIAVYVKADLAHGASVLAIEKTSDVPLYSKKDAAALGRIFMQAKQIASLKQAIGAIKGCFPPAIPIIEVPSPTWYAAAKRNGWEIKKSDDEDARLIGLTVITALREILCEKES